MTDAAAIAKLNDEFRLNPSLGILVLTTGIRAFGNNYIKEIIKQVREYNNFNTDNDPYGEHDFVSIIFKGHKIFWKIDYYDRKFMYLSPNVCKPRLTNRVMTIMLAEEY